MGPNGFLVYFHPLAHFEHLVHGSFMTMQMYFISFMLYQRNREKSRVTEMYIFNTFTSYCFI